jgi:sugar fermentation stimulation protein A
MKYSAPLQCGQWIKRYKRFFLDINTPDGVLTIHCPNTGSMKNCGKEGDKVWYSLSNNPKRKLPGTSEIVELGNGDRIGINTHLANKLVKEALESGVIEELSGYVAWKSEVKIGNSRIDLRGEDSNGSYCYAEVKSLTLLEENGIGCFPDSVTERGQKHLKELIQLTSEGIQAALIFCVQHTGIKEAAPADHIDPEYGRLLREAVSKGVKVLAYRVCFSEDQEKVVAAELTDGIPIRL